MIILRRRKRKKCIPESSKIILIFNFVGYYNSGNNYFQLKRSFLNSLQKDKIFRLVQIESICRRQNNVTDELVFLKIVQNIMGKGENAVFRHFLLFPHYFQKASPGCGKELTCYLPMPV